MERKGKKESPIRPTQKWVQFPACCKFSLFFFSKQNTCAIVFFCRDAVSATQKQNKNQNKTKKLPNLINYFVLECVSILYYHRPIVQFVNSWHWRECAKEIKILLNGFIKILDRLLDTRIYKTDIQFWDEYFILC